VLQKKDNVIGFLFGVRLEEQILVYGYSINININEGTFEDELDKALQLIPGGLHFNLSNFSKATKVRQFMKSLHFILLIFKVL
jgi:hypothetical protein